MYYRKYDHSGGFVRRIINSIATIVAKADFEAVAKDEYIAKHFTVKKRLKHFREIKVETKGEFCNTEFCLEVRDDRLDSINGPVHRKVISGFTFKYYVNEQVVKEREEEFMRDFKNITSLSEDDIYALKPEIQSFIEVLGEAGIDVVMEIKSGAEDHLSIEDWRKMLNDVISSYEYLPSLSESDIQEDIFGVEFN